MPLRIINRPNFKKLIGDAQKASRQTARDRLESVKVSLEDQTRSWKNSPEFKIIETKKSSSLIVKKNKAGKIFGFVNYGTAKKGGKGAAYPIRPKKAQALRFFPGRSPVSQPFKGRSSTKPASGVVFTHLVMHEGIAPRRMDLVAEKTAKSKVPYVRTTVKNFRRLRKRS